MIPPAKRAAESERTNYPTWWKKRRAISVPTARAPRNAQVCYIFARLANRDRPNDFPRTIIEKKRKSNYHFRAPSRSHGAPFSLDRVTRERKGGRKLSTFSRAGNLDGRIIKITTLTLSISSFTTRLSHHHTVLVRKKKEKNEIALLDYVRVLSSVLSVSSTRPAYSFSLFPLPSCFVRRGKPVRAQRSSAFPRSLFLSPSRVITRRVVTQRARACCGTVRETHTRRSLSSGRS